MKLPDKPLKRIQTILLALVPGTVRPIAGSLLVAGALFCLGLMSVHAQTVALDSGLVAYYPSTVTPMMRAGMGIMER